MRKAIIALVLLTLFLVGSLGCQTLQKITTSAPTCQEYSSLASSIQSLAGLLPEDSSERAELLQGAGQVSAQAVLCALGQQPDADLYAHWQERANEIVDARIAAAQAATTAASGATSDAINKVAADPRDEVDLSTVEPVGDPVDIRSWPITVGLTVRIEGNTIVMEMDRLPDWPVIDGSFGNVRAVLTKDGKRKELSVEWTGTDRVIRKSLNDLAGDFKIPSVFSSDWHMNSGDEFWVAVASLSRGKWEGIWRWEYFEKTGKGKDAHERTPFVRVVWP